MSIPERTNLLKTEGMFLLNSVTGPWPLATTGHEKQSRRLLGAVANSPRAISISRRGARGEFLLSWVHFPLALQSGPELSGKQALGSRTSYGDPYSKQKCRLRCRPGWYSPVPFLPRSSPMSCVTVRGPIFGGIRSPPAEQRDSHP